MSLGDLDLLCGVSVSGHHCVALTCLLQGDCEGAGGGVRGLHACRLHTVGEQTPKATFFRMTCVCVCVRLDM